MRVAILAFLSMCFTHSFAQTEVKLEELKDHIGDSVKVKGKISGARYLETAKNTSPLSTLAAHILTNFLPS